MQPTQQENQGQTTKVDPIQMVNNLQVNINDNLTRIKDVIIQMMAMINESKQAPARENQFSEYNALKKIG